MAWHYNLSGLDLDHIPLNTVVTQSYDVAIADNHAASATQVVSVSIGGAGGDNFVFNFNDHRGADTILNFNPATDTIELDGFSGVGTHNQLLAALGSNGADSTHGDATINLGNHDSITVVGVTQDYLQQHLDALVHLNAGATV